MTANGFYDYNFLCVGSWIHGHVFEMCEDEHSGNKKTFIWRVAMPKLKERLSYWAVFTVMCPSALRVSEDEQIFSSIVTEREVQCQLSCRYCANKEVLHENLPLPSTPPPCHLSHMVSFQPEEKLTKTPLCVHKITVYFSSFLLVSTGKSSFMFFVFCFFQRVIFKGISSIMVWINVTITDSALEWMYEHYEKCKIKDI